MLSARGCLSTDRGRGVFCSFKIYPPPGWSLAQGLGDPTPPVTLAAPVLVLLWGRRLRGQRCSSGQQQAKTQLYAEQHSGRPFQQIGLKSHSSAGLNETDCRRQEVEKVIASGSN